VKITFEQLARRGVSTRVSVPDEMVKAAATATSGAYEVLNIQIPEVGASITDPRCPRQVRITHDASGVPIAGPLVTLYQAIKEPVASEDDKVIFLAEPIFDPDLRCEEDFPMSPGGGQGACVDDGSSASKVEGMLMTPCESFLDVAMDAPMVFEGAQSFLTQDSTPEVNVFDRGPVGGVVVQGAEVVPVIECEHGDLLQSGAYSINVLINSVLEGEVGNFDDLE
jgi:hypothetical protein